MGLCGELSWLEKPSLPRVAGPGWEVQRPGEGPAFTVLWEKTPAGFADGFDVECSREGLRGRCQAGILGPDIDCAQVAVGTGPSRGRWLGAPSSLWMGALWLGGKSTRQGPPVSQVQTHS